MEEKSTIQSTFRNIMTSNYFNRKIKEKKKNYDSLNHIKINSIKNTVKKRNPGVDLVRILGMWAIIIHHILVHGLVIKKYNYKILIIMNICSFWHVNSYTLISGIIGYKTNKYSNLMYLWLCVIVYQVGIHSIFIIKKNKLKINSSFYKSCFPIIYSKYWYFTQYFGMYLFLPVINRGISYLTQIEHKILLFSLYGIYIIWNDANVEGNIFGLNSGYSVIWFIISYITGAFIGKYKYNYIEKKKFITFPILVMIFIFSTFICYILQYYKIPILKNIFTMRINSFPMILQSISIILLVININYNKYIGRIICFFGPLTFGIYLIHEHELIKGTFIRNIFSKESNQLKKYLVVKLVFLRSIYIFFICSFIDYIRYIIFQYLLRIKKFCILIEKNIIKLCS